MVVVVCGLGLAVVVLRLVGCLVGCLGCVLGSVFRFGVLCFVIL